MKTIYNVVISKYSNIQELPGAWTNQMYLDILDQLEFGDTTEIALSDLKEMCMIAVTDNEPNEAAKIILDYIFKDRLNNGQKDNLSHEMIEEKIWEEYADLSMHEEFFNVAQFLYQAYNGKFPHPEAVKFQIAITGKKSSDLVIFKNQNEATLIRLIAKGMPDNALINRLYKDELIGESFEEAKDIIWQLKTLETQDNTIIFEAISSSYWFRDLKFVESFEGTTHSDAEDES